MHYNLDTLQWFVLALQHFLGYGNAVGEIFIFNSLFLIAWDKLIVGLYLSPKSLPPKLAKTSFQNMNTGTIIATTKTWLAAVFTVRVCRVLVLALRLQLTKP